MDISVRIFIGPDEFIRFLESASEEGGRILYSPTLNAQYRRVEPGAPLPDDLCRLLRAPRMVDSNHRLFISVGDSGSDPDAMPPNKIITTYFGGFDDRALYISPISIRSNDEDALGLMRRMAKWLRAISRTGVEAWGEPVEPGDKGQLDQTVRYTEEAQRLARSGLGLRQHGVAHVHFEIQDEKSGAAKPSAPRTRLRTAKKG